MTDLDSGSIVANHFVSRALASLLLAAGLALLWAGLPWAGLQPASAQPQDAASDDTTSQNTIQVAGTALAPDDSTEARRLLRSDLGPTSRRWTQLQDSTKRFAAAKTVFQVARVAYPGGAWTSSVLKFLREAGARHPDPEVRAEFLFGGLQVASSAGRGETQKQFYERLTGGHEGSRYAKQAERLFGPDSRVEAGKELPEFQIPKLSGPTETFEKSDFKGQTLLIDFWGTWCGPCIQAMPHLHEAYRKHGGEDFTILSVAMRDTRESVKRFRAEKWEMPWNHAFVPKGSDLQKRLRGRFDIRGLPAAILVGPGGQILSVNRGAGSGEKTARAIQEALTQEDNSAQKGDSAREGSSEKSTLEKTGSANTGVESAGPEGPGL
jgi:thiol-disulfide isomerase/thioredoxin